MGMPYYRRNIFILSATIFLAAVSWNQIIPFLPLFLKDLGVDKTLLPWVGVVFAAHPADSIIAQPFWGKMGDKYGRKVMIVRAGVCLVGVYFGMSVCNSPLQLTILRFLNGALTGFIPGSLALIATNTPDDKAPRYVATAQAAIAAGLIGGPALGGYLASQVGYRGCMQVSGTAVLICTLLVIWLVKEPNKVVEIEDSSLLQDFKTSLSSPILGSLMMAHLLQGFFMGGIGPILALYLGGLGDGASELQVGIIFALPAVAFLLTAHAWTRLGARTGYETGILVGLIGTAALCAILALPNSVILFSVLYLITGVFSSALQPSAGAIVCVRVDQSIRGRSYGMLTSATMIGALISPLVASNIAALLGYRSVFVFVGGLFLAGSLVFRTLVRRWGNMVS